MDASLRQKAAEFIAKFEGFRSAPYQDSVGVWTIGYGTTIYQNGVRVSSRDAPISKDVALNYLANHLDMIYIDIEKLLKRKITDNQIIAVLDFVYNLGIGSFKKSNLLKNINKDCVVADNFRSWNKAGGKILAGLVKRREAEWVLYSA